jgi:hypothetical protein
MNSVLRFCEEIGVKAFAVLAALASILGFIYSVKSDNEWLRYGCAGAGVIAGFVVCWGFFRRTQDLEHRLAAANENTESERKRRQDSEAKLIAIPAEAIGELRNIVGYGARRAWLDLLRDRLEWIERMNELLAVQSGPFNVRVITADHEHLYVVPKCDESAAQLVRAGDPFVLSKITPAGNRSTIGLLSVSQPVNDKGTIVLRVHSVIDETDMTAIKHMATGKELKTNMLRDYRVEVDGSMPSLTIQEIQAAIKVIDELIERFDDVFEGMA